MSQNTKESQPGCVEYAIVILVVAPLVVILLIGMKLGLVSPEQVEKFKNLGKAATEPDSAAEAK